MEDTYLLYISYARIAIDYNKLVNEIKQTPLNTSSRT